MPAEKERPEVPHKYRLSEKKYRSPVIMIVPALGLSTITPVKEMRKVTESPRTWAYPKSLNGCVSMGAFD